MCSQVLFAHAIYHMSKHFCACVGTCACDHMPLLKRPGPPYKSSSKISITHNIFINHYEYKCISSSISSISDHLSQFIIFENFKENNITKNDNQTVFRDFKNFNMDVFEKDLSAIDWPLATH